MLNNSEPLFLSALGALGFAMVGCALIRKSGKVKKIIYCTLVLPIIISLFARQEYHWLASELPTSEGRTGLLIWANVFEGLFLISVTLMIVSIWRAYRSQRREDQILAMAEQIQFNHEQLEMLVSTINGVLWRRDIHRWNFLSLSAQADGFLGYTHQDWYSGAEFFRNLIHPEDLPRVQAAWSRLVQGPQQYQVDFRMKAHDGTYTWVCESGASIHDTQSTLTICGVLKDVHQRYEDAAAAMKAHALQVSAAREAGMAEIAKGVLHNIGNVLNSLNVSAKLHVEGITASRAAKLGKAAKLLQEHADDLFSFLTKHPQGKKLPDYLVSVSEHLEAENRRFYADAHAMVQHIEHMRDVISLQQVHGRTSAFKESVDLASLMEHALLLDGDILRDSELIIERKYADIPPVILSKNLLLQILVNLISNARHAVSAAGVTDRRITLSINPPFSGRIVISVADNGCGISKMNLGRIFSHGFTTRKEGNGFGLHHACLLAEEMGGSLRAESEGSGQGATFFVSLPITETSPSPIPSPPSTALLVRNSQRQEQPLQPIH